MNTYKSIVINDQSPGSHEFQTKEVTSPKSGETLVKVHYSSVNYKDALAVTGKGRILKSFPLTPGIDMAGEVVESSTFAVGSSVIVTGCGIGESINGGYSEYATMPDSIIVPLPDELSLEEAMAYGTAGFTAGLCLARMEINGQVPEKGPIAVTGASGGVGHWAVSFFKSAGYEVSAFSGKPEMHQHLKDIGADTTVTTQEAALGSRPLEKGLYGGAVDNVGGELLAQLAAHTKLWGNIACVGLADSHKLETTVMPLILRGVSLLGVSSGNCPMDLRKEVWRRLSTDLKPKSFDPFITQEISLDELPDFCQKMIDRKTHGRTLVKI